MSVIEQCDMCQLVVSKVLSAVTLSVVVFCVVFWVNLKLNLKLQLSPTAVPIISFFPLKKEALIFRLFIKNFSHVSVNNSYLSRMSCFSSLAM